MPSSGGSVSDAPVNKVVDGKSHYLAYITPDEGKSLMDQGGKEVITDSGIPAYPDPTGTAEEASAYSGVAMGGEAGSGSDAARPPQLGGSSTVEQAEQFRDEGDNKENIIENIKRKLNTGVYTLNDALKIGKTYNLVKNSSFINMLSTAGGAAIALAGTLGKEAQSKAMTWSLENKLKKEFEKPTYDAEAAAYGVYDDKIKGLQKDLEDVKAGTFTQTDYTEKYGSGDIWDKDQDKIGIGRQGEDVRGLTNIITPYAAHAVGGTTQQPSMAAQWYANLGSGPSNPGAFNLTQQYAAAKATVSQRLGTSTSVGQMAVSNSPFFNFLKDNSLNKGIL
jgi:hypothetical protein